jgi:hypothetical protein
MNAIRQFIEVKNNSFNIVLPEGFTAKTVEVIIMPMDIEDDIPQWQKDIVLERIASIKQNPELLIDEEQFWKDFEDAS